MRILSILHNISRHDDGIKQLNLLNTIDLLKEFQSKTENPTLIMNGYMTLALLLTPEEIKNDRKRINSILDYLLEMVYQASLLSDHRVPLYCYGESLHLSAILVVFVKLFNDDRILDYIIRHSQVDLDTSSTTQFFLGLFINTHSNNTNDADLFKKTTSTALVNILWSISFQKEHKEELKNSKKQLKEILNEIIRQSKEDISSDEYVPQYIENIGKAATGLLFNLDESIDHISIVA